MQSPKKDKSTTAHNNTDVQKIVSSTLQTESFQNDMKEKSPEILVSNTRSLKSNEFGGQAGITWVEKESMNSPDEHLERLEVSFDVEGHEVVVPNVDHLKTPSGSDHLKTTSGFSPSIKSFFSPILSSPLKSGQNRLEGRESDDERVRAVGKLDLDECLEWPILPQEIPSFQRISDVLMDASRLSKEASFLLKMIDEDSLPKNVVVCVRDEYPSSDPNTPIVSQSHLATDTSHINSFDIERSEVLDSYAHDQSFSSHDSIFGHQVDDDELSRTLDLQENLDYIATLERMDQEDRDAQNLQNFRSYETKAERQAKRKVRNRECSRLFRHKQKMREDALKKGKMEKEMYLKRLFHERERLRCAIIELECHSTTCSKATSIFSEYRHTYNKENLPSSSGMTY